MSAHVHCTTFVAELLTARLALHMVASFSLLNVKGTVFTRAFLTQALGYKLFEFHRRFLLLPIFTNMSKLKVNSTEPADVQTADVAPKLIIIKITNSTAVRSDAMSSVRACANCSFERVI